ncbi:MAG: SDR family oxidoreductase [Bacteroidota bacterium]
MSAKVDKEYICGMSQPTVLISGVSCGIGRATAERLLKEGWWVFGSVRRAGDANDLSTNFPDRFTELVFDITDTETRRKAIASIHTKGFYLRALVNNAGIAVTGPLETIAEEDYRKQFEVNVFGTLGLTQDCLPLLHAAQEAGAGPVRIVNVSSVSGILTNPFTAIYSASKFAVESLTDGLRRELLPFGIDVISVAPGPVKTPIWQKGLEQTTAYTESRYAFILEKFPAYIENAKAMAIPAEKVATCIYEVLTDKKTKPYHLLIKNAWLIKIISRLPKRMMDRMAWKRLNQNRRY